MKLPEKLTLQDLTTVATALFPDGTKADADALAAYGEAKPEQIDAKKDVVREARLLARKDSRDRVRFSDLEAATKIVDANQEAKTFAMGRGPTGRRKPGRKAAATPLQTLSVHAVSPVRTEPESDIPRGASRALKPSEETFSMTERRISSESSE